MFKLKMISFQKGNQITRLQGAGGCEFFYSILKRELSDKVYLGVEDSAARLVFDKVEFIAGGRLRAKFTEASLKVDFKVIPVGDAISVKNATKQLSMILHKEMASCWADGLSDPDKTPGEVRSRRFVIYMKSDLMVSKIAIEEPLYQGNENA